MARKIKEQNVEPSVFRVMVEKLPYKNITVDFATKEAALEYTDNLTNKDTSWYGVYEISPKSNRLICIKHNRLIPHDDTIPKISKDKTTQKLVKQRRSK